VYGSESWTMKAKDELTITTDGMKFVRTKIALAWSI
jgi:hypothetical protein